MLKNYFEKINYLFFYHFINICLVFLFPFLYFITSYHFSFVIWFTFVPLIWLTLRNNFFSFWLYLFFSLTINAIWSCYYISSFSYSYFLLASAVVTLFPMAAFIVCKLLYGKIKYPLAIFVFPVVWLVVSNVVNLIPSANDCFNYSHFQPMLFPLVWVIGEQGIAFLIMLVNSLVAFSLLNKDKKLLKTLFLIFIVLFFCFLYSRLATVDNKGKEIKVALVQGNIQKDWAWRIENGSSAILDQYKRMSLEAAKNNPDLIIWPEYAIPVDILKNKEVFNELSSLARETNAVLVVGTITETDKTTLDFQYIQNTIQVFERNGNYLGGYSSVLPFDYNGVIIHGAAFPVFQTSVGSFGITACSEENHSFLNRIYVKNGADFLVNVGNEELLTDLQMRKVKSMYSQISAAENHKYILRLVNSGYTMIIDPFGKVISSLPVAQEGILIKDIYLR